MSAALEPYERLISMLERELELAEARRLDALADALAERARFAATLPAQPPAAAAPLLERLTELNERAAQETRRCREAVLEALVSLDRSRSRKSAYAPARLHRYSTSA